MYCISALPGENDETGTVEYPASALLLMYDVN
jgi:hypothetical protein